MAPTEKTKKDVKQLIPDKTDCITVFRSPKSLKTYGTLDFLLLYNKKQKQLNKTYMYIYIKAFLLDFLFSKFWINSLMPNQSWSLSLSLYRSLSLSLALPLFYLPIDFLVCCMSLFVHAQSTCAVWQLGNLDSTQRQTLHKDNPSLYSRLISF